MTESEHLLKIKQLASMKELPILDEAALLEFRLSKSDPLEIEEEYINVYIPVTFDADKAFGLDVCQDTNDDNIDLYAEWRIGEVDSLAMYVTYRNNSTVDGDFYFRVPLDERQQQRIHARLEEQCRAVYGQSIAELYGADISMTLDEFWAVIDRANAEADRFDSTSVRNNLYRQLINPTTSFCYNPFVYVQDDKDVLSLISNLIENTTPSHSKSSDPFWEKSETALLQALMLYLLHEAPPEEQNFSMVMEMIAAAEVHEDDDNYQSPLDILFERLEMREPDSIACKQYRIFKQAAGKTAKSILVSVGVRLAAFNLPSIAKLTMTDELHLQELGERKIALFCCIPDSDKSLNYLVGMIYTQLIQTLYDRRTGAVGMVQV